MRRVLRKIAMGQFDDLGDLSSLAEPQARAWACSRERGSPWEGGRGKMGTSREGLRRGLGGVRLRGAGQGWRPPGLGAILPSCSFFCASHRLTCQRACLAFKPARWLSTTHNCALLPTPATPKGGGPADTAQGQVKASRPARRRHPQALASARAWRAPLVYDCTAAARRAPAAPLRLAPRASAAGGRAAVAHRPARPPHVLFVPHLSPSDPRHREAAAAAPGILPTPTLRPLWCRCAQRAPLGGRPKSPGPRCCLPGGAHDAARRSRPPCPGRGQAARPCFHGSSVPVALHLGV
jgi:hypothetical protein